MPENGILISTFEALEKLRKYCAYCERSQFDVRLKLTNWNIDEVSCESIISTLIEENFVNEERYAKAFTQGKIRINHWGKIKIKQSLRQHKISEPCIKMAFASIDYDEYLQVLIKEGAKKVNQLKGSEILVKHKTIQYLIGKGFESEMIWENIDQIIKIK